MKIGIVSDIHSNIQAFREVLKEFDARGVEKILCCGDMIGIGINPEEVLQEILKRKDQFVGVLGNHEKYLLEGFPEVVHEDERPMASDEIENHRWNHHFLLSKSREFIQSLNVSELLEIEGKKIYITHYPMFSDGTYKRMIKTPIVEECQELFQGIQADIYLYGHTHTRSIVQCGEKYYINPGSLGCPGNTNIAKASILTITKESLDYEELNIEYNADEIRNEINELKFPFYKGILKIFYGVDNEKE